MSKKNPAFAKKNYLIVGSMIFALFFGAGNLIFPLHLGQLAARNWPWATIGFLITGALLPLLSVVAIAVSHAKGIYDVALPLGHWFALTFLVLIHATIGPLFGTPRTATVSFTVGIAPLLSPQFQKIGLLIFTALFFACAFLISYRESQLLTNLGKILNPIFLILLGLVILISLIHPLGNPSLMTPTPDYLTASKAFTNGFLQGYNTLDTLAGLAFAVTIITAIMPLSHGQNKSVGKIAIKSGILGMSAIGLIYLLLLLIGAMSLGRFKVSADGGIAFSQLVNAIGGRLGQVVLAVLIVLTCLTTAVGLVAAFAQEFHAHFSRLNYHAWLAISCFASFLTANLGLEKIIAWSLPLLMLLYPIAMVLVLLSIGASWFDHDRVVYLTTILFTTIPSGLDMIVYLPPLISQSTFGHDLAKFRQLYLPLSQIGFSWLLPALFGLVLGLIIHVLHAKKS